MAHTSHRKSFLGLFFGLGYPPKFGNLNFNNTGFHYFGLGKESLPQALGYSEQIFTWLGLAWLDLAWLSLARLSSARLGPARLGSASAGAGAGAELSNN